MTWTGQYHAVGAFHPDLMGSGSSHRFRPKRIPASDLGTPLTCRIEIDGSLSESLSVFDISPTGLGVHTGHGIVLEPGTTIPRLRLEFRDAVIFEGEAIAVYQVDRPQPRVGLRFTSSILDLDKLLISDRLIGQRLDEELARQAEYVERLPVEYRAALADMQHLLQQTKLIIEQLEREAARGDWWQATGDSRELLEQIYRPWGPRYHERMKALAELDATFDEPTRVLARSYATDLLMPLLYDGPLHRRSYEKPRGYAGDYQIMLMCFAKSLLGNSLWSKFLHNVALHYPMVRTVPSREANMRRAIHGAASQPGDRRIFALACGPAVEVGRFLDEVETLDGTKTFFLVDQDEEALAYCHDSLNRKLVDRHKGQLPVDLQCLHFSVRQLLKPEDPAEVRVVHGILKNLDLIYSAGLLDYLPAKVATTLIQRLYAQLRPGGRLLIGNLQREPLTAWLLESVLAWHLEYRDEAAMLALVDGLQPAPSRVEIERDDTGYCMFLSIHRPE
jgi:SAM-dependent methyltransferase